MKGKEGDCIPLAPAAHSSPSTGRGILRAIHKTGVHIGGFLDALESTENTAEAKAWFAERMTFLPGKTWPEKWLISCTKAGDLNKLADILQVPEYELLACLESAETSVKHSEIYQVATELSLDPDYILGVLARQAAGENSEAFDMVRSFINRLLE